MKRDKRERAYRGYCSVEKNKQVEIDIYFCFTKHVQREKTRTTTPRADWTATAVSTQSGRQIRQHIEFIEKRDGKMHRRAQTDKYKVHKHVDRKKPCILHLISF